MFGDAEGEREVDHEQDTPSSEAIASKPRPRAITKVAPKMPKIAPEAPTVSASGVGSSERAEGAGEQRGEVEGDEARRADRRLEQPAEEEERRTC